MSIADKLTTISNNEQSVYNAGVRDGRKKPYIDSSKITDYSSFFANNKQMALINNIDTSNATNFAQMFYQNTQVVTAPVMDTSKGTSFTSMFTGASNLTSVPQLDVSNAANLTSLFNSCVKIQTLPVLDTSKCTVFEYFCYWANQLINISQLDTSNGTKFKYAFADCKRLVSLPTLDISKATDVSNMFFECFALKNITFSGEITLSISFSDSPLTVDSVKSIITALKDYSATTTKRTLTLKSTVKEAIIAEGETAPGDIAWIAYAQTKGWTVA